MVSSDQRGSTTDLNVVLNHTRELLKKRPDLAEKQAAEILGNFPGEINAVVMLGAARRLQGRPDEALPVLKDAIAKSPDYCVAYQEAGLTLLALGRRAEAVKALQRAVEIEPKLFKSWMALGTLLYAEGDEEGALHAQRMHFAATVEHKELAEAADHLLAGDITSAEAVCRDLLSRHPDDVSVIKMLADIGTQAGALEDAQELLEHCLDLAPEFALARYNYASVLYKRRKCNEALAELDILLRDQPDSPQILTLLADVHTRIGNYQKAINLYEDILERFPHLSKVQLSYGHVLRTIGRQEDAAATYRAVIEQRPGLGEAYWCLADIKTSRFEDAEIDAMRRRLDAGGAAGPDFYNMCFALGKALEDREQYEAAFDCYQRGNAARRGTVQYDAGENEIQNWGLADFFDRDFFKERKDQGCPSPDPIFIVGLPRSGSTLIEQILASHSDVEGTMELPEMLSIARRLSGKKRVDDPSMYPGVMAGLSAEELASLGAEYLSRTKIYRSGAPFFIDKMPNNFSHVGLIHMILPNAKIIDARRHPMACCFSAYKQLFAQGQNFTYSLEEIGRYYRNYVELMDHWESVLPGRVLRVQYEKLVADIDGQVRRLLEYCSLPFEDGCVAFHKTKRAVRSASSEQVRQPVYTGAVEHWRHFEAHLEPLRAALGPVLDRYPT